ncbi:MAG: DUF4381 domain-containing protein [Gammaproteobacteria bacterium]|nr:MAG: DUF4381 domain-containing protein [Gammaproteobacteria bacterium]
MDIKLAAQLKDIHLPAEPGIWPLALGWWLLLAFAMALVIAAMIAWARYKRKKPRRDALHQLEEIEKQYLRSKDCVLYVQEISKILRRVGMQAFSRRECAQLNGHDWLQFLQSHSESASLSDNISKCLLYGPYSKETDLDVSELFKFTQQWIRRNL